MKSGSCARNRKRRANERGGTPSADGYYRSLSPPSSLFHSLFLLRTQLDARYFRRPSSFGQFHCTVGFPPLSPFLPLCLSLPLPCRVSCHAKHASSENAPRRDTPHHYLPGEIPRALFNEAKIAREQAAPSKFRYVFSRIIITRARARASTVSLCPMHQDISRLIIWRIQSLTNLRHSPLHGAFGRSVLIRCT